MGKETDTNMMGWCECDVYRNDRVYCDLQVLPEKEAATAAARCDVGAWGLRSHYDEAEGRAVGLCTESLGSESMFDDRSASDEDADDYVEEEEGEESKARWWRARRGEEKIGKPRHFPPPIPSLLQRGSARRSCSFIKAERNDGRLVLTEFTIQRPEILRAEREDGRLRLHLVTPPQAQEAEGEEEDDGEQEEAPEEEDSWRWKAAEEGDSSLMTRFGNQIGYAGSNMNNNIMIESFWQNNPPCVTTA